MILITWKHKPWGSPLCTGYYYVTLTSSPVIQLELRDLSGENVKVKNTKRILKTGYNIHLRKAEDSKCKKKKQSENKATETTLLRDLNKKTKAKSDFAWNQ